MDNSYCGVQRVKLRRAIAKPGRWLRFEFKKPHLGHDHLTGPDRHTTSLPTLQYLHRCIYNIHPFFYSRYSLQYFLTIPSFNNCFSGRYIVPSLLILLDLHNLYASLQQCVIYNQRFIATSGLLTFLNKILISIHIFTRNIIKYIISYLHYRLLCQFSGAANINLNILFKSFQLIFR